MEKDHGLRIPNEASIHKNPKRLGWGRRIGQIDFGAFGILSAELQGPMFFINQPLFLQKLSIYIHTQIFIWDWDLNLGRKEFKVLINLKIHINGCYWLWLWMPQNEHPDENIPFHLKQKGGVVLPLSNGLLWPWNNYNLWLGKSPLIKNSYVAKMVLLSDWLLGWPFKNQILNFIWENIH